MLARRGVLSHPLAGTIELPLLIPAFSSKGFGFLSKGKGKLKREYSEIAYALADFTKQPLKSVLISAYDLYFNHFEDPEMKKGKFLTGLRNSRLVVIDSGGYELISDFDSTENRTFVYNPKPGYSRKEYEATLKRITDDKNRLHLIITNYDHDVRGHPITDQIRSARSIFRKNSNCLNDFILKPWTKGSNFVDPAKMSDTELENLKGFDIIGITEKDLGTNINDRIKKIALLRHKLNEVGVSAPIHVWGGLDPIMTPLFFFAGAEIFDGISWLRYAFRNGIAINRECYSILKAEFGINTSSQLNRILAGFENLRFLENLTSSLQQWVDFEGNNFDMFDNYIKDNLKQAYETLKTTTKYM